MRPVSEFGNASSSWLCRSRSRGGESEGKGARFFGAVSDRCASV